MARVVIVLLLVVLVVGAIAFRVDASADALGVVGEAFRPFQGAVTFSGRGVGGFFEALREVNDLHSENVRLRRDVDAQEALKSRIIELERENADMRALLDFTRDRPADRFLPARIIAWDPGETVNAVTLDRGRDDGVRNGMVVVTPLGLVGQVQRVTRSTATVVLITDTRTSVSALVQGSRARGIVEGTANVNSPLRKSDNYLTLRYVDKDRDLKPGDLVITSAMGGSYPEALPIGQIVDIDRTDAGRYQEARVLPVVNLSRLEDVLILVSFQPRGFD